MSVINQMLQDLEKRAEGDSTHAGARYTQAGVAAPNARRGVAKLWLVFLLIALLAGGMFLVQSRRQTVELELKQVSVKESVLNSDLPATQNLASGVSAIELQHQSPSLSELGLRLKLSTQVNPANLVKNLETNKPIDVTSSIPKALPTSASITPMDLIKTEKESRKTVTSLEEEKTRNQTVVSEKQATAPVIMVKEISEQQRAETEYRQATIYQQQGRANEAILSLQNALKLDSLHAPARQLLISLLLENKRHEDAIRELKQGLVIEPSQLNFSMILARLLVERAKLNEAIDTLQRNQNLAQDRPDYLAFLAALQQKIGRHQDAVQLYRQALKKHPHNGVWWMGLGISLQAEGKVSEAIEAYQQAKQQSGLSAELQAFVEQKIVNLQK